MTYDDEKASEETGVEPWPAPETVEERRWWCLQLSFAYYERIRGEGYEVTTPANMVTTAKVFERYMYEWHQEALNKLKGE